MERDPRHNLPALLSDLLLPAGVLLALSLGAGNALAADAPAAVAGGLATGGLQSGDLAGASLRMVGGLLVVLGLLALTAWLSRRFRLTSRLQGGAIEVTTGLSLGAREKVVLLRVGREQVLVGISPAGMRTLHVLKDPAPAGFSDQMKNLETAP
jgi:flagellar biosynthetic protein FliO